MVFCYSSLNGLRQPYYLWCNIKVKVSYVVEVGGIRIYIWYWKSPGTGWYPWESESRQEERKDWAWALQSLQVGRTREPQERKGWEGTDRGVSRKQGLCVLKSSEKTLLISILIYSLWHCCHWDSDLGAGFSFRKRKAARGQPWGLSHWPSWEDSDCCVMSNVYITGREDGIRESALS